MKIKRLRYNIKNMKHYREKCGLWEIDIHRAPHSRHLKSKKHLENMAQSKVIVPQKNPIKRVVKEEIEVPVIDTKDLYLYFLTDKILNAALKITVENHHDKNVYSIITITPN